MTAPRDSVPILFSSVDEPGPAGAKYRALFESNPVPMIVYEVSTLRVLAVNAAAVLSYGYTRDEFLGLTIAELRPPEDVEKLLRVVRELPSGYYRSGSWRHRRKDGTIFPVEVTSHSLELDGVATRLVLVTDITERSAAQEALRDSEERFRSIVENSPLGLFRTNGAGRFVLANSALARILGYCNADELLDVELVSMCATDSCRAQLGAALGRGEAIATEGEWRRRDGKGVTVRLTARRVTGVGTAPGYEGFVEDVTPLRRAEEALHHSEKLAAIGQLISGVAHELNNPLSAILLFVETLLNEAQSDEDRDALTMIRDQARRSRAIVRDLLSSARGGDVRRVRTNPVAMLERTARGLTLQVEELGARLDLSLAGRLPDVELDGSAIAQVVTNLVVNAAQAAGQDGVVRLRSRAADARIEIVVEDTGPGIPPDVMPHLFEPFFTTKPHGEGTGLGLAVSHGIIETHGGSLTAENLPAGGARFVVTLPVVGDPAPPTPAPSVGRPRPAGDARRVLVIDDEVSIRVALSRYFSRRGWVVDQAENGAVALRTLLGEEGDQYCMVISDLKMPGLSGIELYDRLSVDRPDLLERMIFSTGDVASADARAFLDRSRCTVLQKPFELTTLDEHIARLTIPLPPS